MNAADPLTRAWREFVAGFASATGLARLWEEATGMPLSRPPAPRRADPPVVGAGGRTDPPRQSRGEAACRAAAERLTGVPFIRERPKFLRNPVTGRRLELDCYCAPLALAVEYQGRQHYGYVPAFHDDPREATLGAYRDELKRRLCAEAGVRLVEVPYDVPPERIEAFLRPRLIPGPAAGGRILNGGRPLPVP